MAAFMVGVGEGISRVALKFTVPNFGGLLSHGGSSCNTDSLLFWIANILKAWKFWTYGNEKHHINQYRHCWRIPA